MYDEKNTDCALYGSPECELLNAGACLGCSVGKMKPEEQSDMKAALARLREAAPEETVEQLYTSKECLLCKGENKNEADCYALFDMTKEDPAGDWSFNIGSKKVTPKTGFMLLPLQACSCGECRKRYRTIEFVPIIISLVLAALALIIVTLKPVYNALHGVGAWMPFATFAVSVLVAIFIGAAVRSALIKKYSGLTELDVSRLAPVAELEQRGWQQAIKKKNGVSKLVFASKLRETGVYTRREPEPEEQPEAEAEAAPEQADEE